MFSKIINALCIISFIYFVGEDVHKILYVNQDITVKKSLLDIGMLVFDSIVLSFLMIPMMKKKIDVYSVISDRNIEGVFDNYMDAKEFINKLKINRKTNFIIVRNNLYINKSVFDQDKLKGKQI